MGLVFHFSIYPLKNTSDIELALTLNNSITLLVDSSRPGETRADQKTDGALFEFPMRTAIHGKTCASAAISVCDNYQNFRIGFSTVAVAQCVRRQSSVTGKCKLKVRARLEIYANFFPAMIFISNLLVLMDFSDIVILCSKPNRCCQQNLNPIQANLFYRLKVQGGL